MTQDAAWRRDLEAGLAALGQEQPGGAAERYARLIEKLARWGARVNLTAIREPQAMVAGHILDSLAVRPWLHGRRVIDIGTGAGFPGLPLAIAEPRRQFVLLDSNGRKIRFVQHMIAELGLDNTSAVQSRAENYAPGERFDTVIARALAAMPGLVKLAAHLMQRDGVLLAQKGKYPAAELDELSKLPDLWEYSVSELTIPGLEQRARHLVCLRRAPST
ncbi:MAG: 16S rRNA (guanine(527)-N(7))-methyltransferase RsmG [Gammaproteobacteria bacterium]|nr:MAG: 16S rRNA (guanine(527)-N(7))-methyltransferase RsmG [Gammaproteobacteria bacterium]